MPNLFLLCSETSAASFSRHANTIGLALRQATSDALGLDGPQQVALYCLPFAFSSNTSPYQIIGLASYTRERAERKKAWRDALAQAWAQLADAPELGSIAGTFQTRMESWVILPSGLWGLFLKGVEQLQT